VFILRAITLFAFTLFALSGLTDATGVTNDVRTTLFDAHADTRKLGAPKEITGSEFYRSENDYRFVRLCGKVNELIKDEIDPSFAYLVLFCQGEIVYAAIRDDKVDPLSVVGGDVELTGTTVPRLSENRRFLGRTLQTLSVTILKAPPADPFDAPDISHITLQTPGEIARAGRHSACGRVLAVWNRGRTFLIRTDAGLVVQVDHARTQPPVVGMTVRVVGIPLTNTHCLNLARADWADAPKCAEPERQVAHPTSARDIMEDASTRVKIKPQYHGRLIRLVGSVRGLFVNENRDRRLLVESDGYLIPVDLYACPTAPERASAGCTVAVEGICVMDIETMTSGLAFPHIRGFSVIPCEDAAIVVITRPPWFTVARLFALAGGLFALLVVVLVWNFSLRRMAVRRGRELFRTQVGKITSELRVKERTRLAVELHDSLAQNLTGVSMEIETAERSREDGIEAVFRHLAIADRTLKSCRNELRNSLWDLRSQALDAPDLDTAIRQTLLPHVKGVRLSVRFTVPRARFSDNTLHEILRMIRELALNGIRHGGATEIRIAGAIEDDRLRFSVTDNGGGFDPDAHPGVSDGHFGLQGISERLDAYAGELAFVRVAGGMKAIVTIPLPRQEKPEK